MSEHEPEDFDGFLGTEKPRGGRGASGLPEIWVTSLSLAGSTFLAEA